MLLLLLIILPIASATLIVMIRIVRPLFAYHWLVAALGSLFTWILAWVIRPEAPLYLPLTSWQPHIYLTVSPALLLDSISWPYLIALTTLTLAVLTTDIARPTVSRSAKYWFELMAYLLLTALSMLAVLSGNLLTLLLGWTLLVSIEMIAHLRWVQDGMQSRDLVIAFALRLASIGCVIWAGINAEAAGSPQSFTTVSPHLSALLLAAAGIYLGIIPLHTPFPKNDSKGVGVNVLLRLTTSAPALVLLARVGMAGAPENLEGLFLLLGGLAVIYGGLAWTSIPSVQEASPFWLICLASLSLVSAAHGQSDASVSWGIAALFTGGVFCLATSQLRGLALIWMIGLISISALPFSPTWEGAGMYAPHFQPMMVFVLVGQSLFLAGTLRHALRLPPEPLKAERWVGSLYVLGLLLLLTSHFTVVLLLRPATGVIGQQSIGWIETGISMVALGLAVLSSPLYFRHPGRIGNRLSALVRVFELAWVYRIVGGVYQVAERIIASIGVVMEGRAGILWTLLVLALLVSLFVSLGSGG